MVSADFEDRLERILTAEAAAYGYTLSIWGAGALLIDRLGMPGTPAVFGYILAAVAGFAAVAAVAFQGLTSDLGAGAAADLRVVSAIHVGATGGNLLVAHLLVVLTAGALPKPAVFALVGFQATVLYNLLLLLQDELADRIT